MWTSRTAGTGPPPEEGSDFWGGTPVASRSGMAKAATRRRIAEVPTQRDARPPVTLRVVHARPPRRGRGVSPALVTIEWFMLTMVGVVMMALATG